MRAWTKQRHNTPDSACRNLLVGGCGLLIEERLCGEDHAAQAEAALRGLLVDERLLKRVRPLRRAEAFERGDFARPDGRLTGVTHDRIA